MLPLIACDNAASDWPHTFLQPGCFCLGIRDRSFTATKSKETRNKILAQENTRA